jgi:hypothetical protein
LHLGYHDNGCHFEFFSTPQKLQSFMKFDDDHFCVFQFFSILAISMATAAILKKSTLKSTTSHAI